MEFTVYRHYKGGMYKLLGVAKHSETLEDMVVYQELDGEKMWVRPKEMFFEHVTVDGKVVPRFEKIDYEN